MVINNPKSMSTQKYLVNREIRVFISSTFHDLDDERRYLINSVFPELRGIASRRNVSITEIDLRWGITEEEAKQGKTVEICLDEIEAAVPFFIGIVGERYGWCPSEGILHQNPSLNQKYGEWLQKDMQQHLGMTEIEMQYGVLRRPETIYANFYVKDKTDTERDEQLIRLIDAIDNNNRYPVYRFSQKEEIGKIVRDSFIKLLDELFPESKDETSQDINYRTCQAVIFENAKKWFHAGDSLEKLHNFLECSDQDETVLYGEGKTSILSSFVSSIKDNNKYESIPIIIGCTEALSQKKGIANYIVAEVRRLYKIHDVFIPSFEKWEDSSIEEMNFLFSKIESKKPLVLILDGINKLPQENYDNTCHWMPHSHPGVKIIFSTVLEDTSFTALESRGLPFIHIHSFSHSELKEYIKKHLLSKKKGLDDYQIDQICRCPLSGSIKGVTLLLDELVFSGRFDTLNELISRYCSCPSILEMYHIIITRLKEDYGSSDVEKVIGLLTICPDGLSETEIRGVLGITQLKWSQLFQSSKALINVENGLVKLPQALLADALSVESEGLIQQLLGYFESIEKTVRVREVLAHLYYNTEDSTKLYSMLTSAEYVVESYKYPAKRRRMAIYWEWLFDQSKLSLTPPQVLNSIYLNNDNFGFVLSLLATFFCQDLNRFDFATFFAERAYESSKDSMEIENAVSVSNAFYTMAMSEHRHSRLKTASSFYIKAIEALSSIPDISYKQKLSKAYLLTKAAICLAENGDINKAKEYIKLSYDIVESMYGANSIEIANCMGAIANLYKICREPKQAATIYEKAIELLRKACGNDSLFELDYSVHLSFIMYDLRRDEEGYALAKHVLDRLKDDQDHQGLVRLANTSLGSYYSRMNSLDLARSYYEKALEICLKIYGEQADATAESYHNLGTVCDRIGDNNTSFNCKKKALGIRLGIYGENHIKTAGSLNALGTYYYREGQYSEALDYQKRALEIREFCYGKYSRPMPESYSNVVRCYNALNKPEIALSYAKTALEICIRVYGESDPETAFAYCDLGDTYINLKDLENGTSNHERSYEILLKCYNPMHRNLEHIYYKLTYDYWHMANPQKALEFADLHIKCCETNHKLPSEAVASAYRIKGEFLALLERPEAIPVLMSALKSLGNLNCPLKFTLLQDIMVYSSMLQKQ